LFKNGVFEPKLFSVLRQGYSWTDFRSDVIAGLTVAIVALPLAMALGVASGASPDKGLVSAIIGGFLISFLGGSRVQIGGPTGAFVVVIFNIIAMYGYSGMLIATLMAGVMLVIAGFLKAGKVIKYIPFPVVTGFTTGIAVVLASTQVKEFLGLRLEAVPSDFIAKWYAYLSVMGTVSWVTLATGILTLGTIVIVKSFFPKIPAYLVGLLFGSGAVIIFDLPVATVGSQFPALPSTLPFPQFPEISYERIVELLSPAMTIAFLAGVEALLSAMVADGMTGYRHRSNQELVGQGVANCCSALFGGLPVTGAIARTATNVTSGAKSPLSGMFHALFLLLFMMVGTDLMRYVPMATLSAILFVVAWGMSDIHNFIRIATLSKGDRLVLLLTFALTVFVDLTVAIAVGVTVASLVFMERMSRSVEISRGFQTVSDQEEEGSDQRTTLPQDVEVFAILGPLFYAIAGELPDVLKRIGKQPKVLILRMRFVPYLDASGAAALDSIVKESKTLKSQLIISGLQQQPAEMLMKFRTASHWESVLFARDYDQAISLANSLVVDL
jgi:SulP family sulfate permease